MPKIILKKITNMSLKYIDNELSRMIATYSDFNGKVDADKLSLEFLEILPMPSAIRLQLVKDLKKSQDPRQILKNLLENQWQERQKFFGPDIADNILAYAVIQSLDPLWVEHLTALDDLREGVRLRGYAQKDPLIEYRKEGYDMFQNLMSRFEANLSRMLFRLEPVTSTLTSAPKTQEGRGEMITPEAPESSPETPKVVKSLDRFDPGI